MRAREWLPLRDAQRGSRKEFVPVHDHLQTLLKGFERWSRVDIMRVLEWLYK